LPDAAELLTPATQYSVIVQKDNVRWLSILSWKKLLREWRRREYQT